MQQAITTLQPTDRDTIPYAPAIYLDIFLRLTVKDGIVNFSYSQDGKHFTSVKEHFKMREGKWIGAKFGFVAVETDAKCDLGWIDADWIRVTK